MSIKKSRLSDRVWLFSSLVGFSILYLNLIWRTTENIDRLTIDGLFWVAIIWLLWRKRDRLSYQSSPLASFLGLGLIGIILFKTISLFWFESILIPLTPVCFAISFALTISGFKGLWQCWKELFLAVFLFFPTETLGQWIDNLLAISVLTAKFSTYGLYYFGLNIATQGNKIFLSIPDTGEFQVFVKYACTGVPMMLLMLRLALLLIGFFSFTKIQLILIPTISVVMGFFSGVIRVCILTLAVPNPARFEYWHGNSGSQIFSTFAVCIFAGFCYWIWQQQEAATQPNFESSIPENSLKF